MRRGEIRWYTFKTPDKKHGVDRVAGDGRRPQHLFILVTQAIACALVAKSDLFVTTDDVLLRKLRGYPDLTALPPGAALAKVEHWYED